MQDSNKENSPKKYPPIQKEKKFHISYLPKISKPSTKEKRKMICKKYREKKKNYIISLKTEISNLQYKQNEMKQHLSLSILDNIINIIISKAKSASIPLHKEIFLFLTNSSCTQLEIDTKSTKEQTFSELNNFFSLYTSFTFLQKQ